MNTFKEKKEIREYIHWMCNSENIENCTECPENREMRGHKYPCGQQVCWVVSHTRSSEEEEED